VDKQSDLAVAAGHSVDVAGWRNVLDQVFGAFAGRFARVETRRAAAGFVTGLLADLEVKTSWQLAEYAGHARPDAMQRLLYRAVWDADAVRDDVRALVVQRLGDPDGVLVPDETGDLKKGTHTVGVQRQIGFCKRWELAADMITAAVDAGVPARWVAADEAYGNSGTYRARLRELGLGYVLAVSCDHLVPLDGGKTRLRADRIAADLPTSAWQRRSAGTGSKGPRWYDWAWLDQVGTDADSDDDGQHSVLIRKNTTTGELAFYRCWSPHPASLAQLVRIAGIRRTVERGSSAWR
jgi:SRSO17 transposase